MTTPTEVESHERLVVLHVILSEKDGLYTAVPCNRAGARVPDLKYQARVAAAAVAGAVRNVVR